MTGSALSSAGLDSRRRRILFRAWRRGTLELDLAIGSFADAELARLSDDELDVFERLLDAPDAEVLGWVVGDAPLPAEFDTPLFARIRRGPVKTRQEKQQK
jgi:antitoxin CptB